MSAQALKPMDVRLMNGAAWVLGLVAASVLLIHFVRWATQLPALGVQRIIVEGDTTHQNELTLRANLAGKLAGNFFLMDLMQARKAFESIPWVRRAVVRREFPGRLRVTLEEHRSTGIWGMESESRMINTYGEVFDANVGDAGVEFLPRLVGMDQQAGTVLAMYRHLAARLQDRDVEIEMLELTARSAWKLQLDSGTTFELGRGTADEVVARFERFMLTHERVLATYGRSDWDRLESVDLRNGQGYAIRLRGVTTLAAPALNKK
jgi:cell division protein FtsQ